MSFDVPSRDAILACADPGELFGDALASPRDLKRAYAALVRAFRASDDPEVFQHVRTLYERARARPEPEEPSERAPSELLHGALAQRDPQAALDLLGDHAALLIAEDPDAVVAALRLLVFGAGPLLSEQALDVVEIVLARPDLSMHPELAEELVGDALRLRALAAAARDPDVPEPMLDALRGGWRRSPDQVARAWLPAAEALVSVGVQPVLRHLEAHHPAVLGVYHRQALRLQGNGPAPALPEEVILEQGRRLPPSSQLGELAAGPLVDLLLTRGGLFAVVVLGYGIASMAGYSFVPALVAGGVARYAVLIAVRLALMPRLEERAAARLHDGDLASLLELARTHAAWPEEVARQLVPLEPVPLSAGSYAYVDGHPLLELRRSPGAILEVLTPAHVARVEREVAEAADG